MNQKNKLIFEWGPLDSNLVGLSLTKMFYMDIKEEIEDIKEIELNNKDLKEGYILSLGLGLFKISYIQY